MEKALKGDAQEQHEKYDLANMTSTCCTRVIIFFIFKFKPVLFAFSRADEMNE